MKRIVGSEYLPLEISHRRRSSIWRRMQGRMVSSIMPMIGALLLLLAFSPQEAGAQSVKVGSYNIRVETTDDGVNNWPFRKQNVVDLIQNRHALDIVGTQEDENHQITYLETSMPGYDFVGRGAGSSSTSGEYCAIFYKTSRFQLMQPAQTRWLSTSPTTPGSISWGAQFPRVVTQAKFKDLQTNSEFWVFNTHFEHGSHGVTARNESALLLKQWINDVGNIPVIVTGDFNAQPSTSEIQTILSTPISNSISISQSGHTGAVPTFGMASGWTSISGTSVLDYIFVKNGITVQSHLHATDQYLLSGAMRFPSDHLPVITSITIPPPSGGSGSVTLKNGVGGYNGTVSFGVHGQIPNTNLTSNDYKHVTNALGGANAYVYRAFYKFNVSSIPAGSTITSATLQLKCEFSSGSTDGGIKIHRVKPVNNAFTVNYATATRNTYNGSNAWTGGANAAGDVANSNNDFLDTPDSTTTLPAEGLVGNITFDVKSSVQAWVNGEANNGWVVLPNARTVYLNTATDLHGPNDYPVLTVNYQSSAPPPSVTKVLKNGSNGYTGSASFGVHGQIPNTHLTSNDYKHVVNHLAGSNAYVYRSFYKFDLTQGANAIPANAVIESATLRVKIEYGGSGGTIAIHRVKPVNNAFTVNYATATRNTYNGSNSWTGGANAGGDAANSNNDFVDTPDASATLPADGSYMTVNVTPSVQAWVNGEANNGWLWITNGATVYMGTATDLHGSGDYPELTVRYH